MNYTFYDNAARRAGIKKSKVASIVKKYKLPKRKIWGCMAVDSSAWERCLIHLELEKNFCSCSEDWSVDIRGDCSNCGLPRQNEIKTPPD